MGDDEKYLKIKSFDGTNFNNWRFRMLAFLEQLEVVNCVEKQAFEEDFWEILNRNEHNSGEERKGRQKNFPEEIGQQVSFVPDRCGCR